MRFSPLRIGARVVQPPRQPGASKDPPPHRQLIATALAVSAPNAVTAVDVSQASRAQLETVKGIGPGLSGKIVQARQSGGVKNWDDLVQRVGGIGIDAGNAARLPQGGLTAAGAAYAAKPATAAKPAKAPKAAKAATPARSDS